SSSSLAWYSWMFMEGGWSLKRKKKNLSEPDVSVNPVPFFVIPSLSRDLFNFHLSLCFRKEASSSRPKSRRGGTKWRDQVASSFHSASQPAGPLPAGRSRDCDARKREFVLAKPFRRGWSASDSQIGQRGVFRPFPFRVRYDKFRRMMQAIRVERH